MKIKGKEYRTIWFENNVVKIIDQTKLPHQFEIKDLNTIITKYSKCLNIILDNLIDDKIVIKKNITEDHLLNNFSKSWLDILSMMIGLSLIWRRFLKSMENWFIFGTCGLNQMYNLKDSKNFKPSPGKSDKGFFERVRDFMS